MHSTNQLPLLPPMLLLLLLLRRVVSCRLTGSLSGNKQGLSAGWGEGDAMRSEGERILYEPRYKGIIKRERERERVPLD